MSVWTRLLILPILLTGLCVPGCGKPAPLPPTSPYILTIDGHKIGVAVAITAEQQRRGLMHRTELDENAGMLFVYDKPRIMGFWMENTLIPLSIAFIDGDGVIRDIQDMEPLDKTTHYSAVEVLYALEVNQGWFKRHDVSVGAKVTFSPELNELIGRE